MVLDGLDLVLSPVHVLVLGSGKSVLAADCSKVVRDHDYLGRHPLANAESC